MFWTIVDRIVSLTFLLLSIVIIITLVNFSEIRNQTVGLSLSVENAKQELQKVQINNLSYLENKINRGDQRQDDYQVVISRRVEVLESKIASMDKENKELKNQSKVVNYNNSSAIVNK